MAIDGTGNFAVKVGIGLKNPKQNLHIHEDSESTQNLLKITNEATGSTDIDGLDVGVDTDGSGRLYLQENQDLAFGTNDLRRATIKNSEKVGIGTSGPTQKLHIHEELASTQNFIKITNAATGSSTLDGLDVGVHIDGSGSIYLQEDLDLEFGTNGLRRVTIKNSGDAGIRTSDPVQMLHLHKDQKAPDVIGMTSKRNLQMVANLGLYDITLSYNDVERLDITKPTLIVDMSGNGVLMGTLHKALGEQMKHTLL